MTPTLTRVRPGLQRLLDGLLPNYTSSFLLRSFPSSKAVAQIWPPGFRPPWETASPISKSVAWTPSSTTSVHVWFTFLGSLVPLKRGPHPFWTPKREEETGDPFGVVAALLSAAAKCFRAWASVEILWRRVLLPLLAVAGRCHRAQPLRKNEGATKHKHGMTCAAELFYLRHVRSCAASVL